MDLIGGGVDFRGSYVLKILYVKMKELGPLGGVRAGRTPPRSANVMPALIANDSNKLNPICIPTATFYEDNSHASMRFFGMNIPCLIYQNCVVWSVVVKMPDPAKLQDA